MYVDKLLLLGKATVQNFYDCNCWKNWSPTQTLIKELVSVYFSKKELNKERCSKDVGLKNQRLIL